MKIPALLLGSLLLLTGRLAAQPINRQALVERHKVVISTTDTLSSLSVGNGAFAFTADVTGLQTFPEYYQLLLRRRDKLARGRTR